MSFIPAKDQKELYSMLKSFLRTFAAASLAQLFATGIDVLSLDGDTLRMILSSGLSAALLVCYNSLNPNYSAYGKGSKS